jgi:sugar lactone lactonase YvrE
VTTIAGYAGTVPIRGNIDGVGAKAAFWGPSGVAYDGAGNLYVADQDAQTIRKIVVATAQVTTLAGSPMMTGNTDGTGAVARFSNPIGATTDGAGNIYVADYRNGAIRQIVAATGAVTTLVTGLLSPTDVLWDGAGNLYVSEVGTGSIRKIVVATKAVSTAAAAGSPTGLALDGAGNLYFSDSGSRTVRKLAGGVVTTVVGTMGVRGVQPGPLPGGINLPWGLAWVPNQGLVICDYGENVIVMARGL